MTIRQLKQILDKHPETADVFVALFKPEGNCETFEIESCSDNNNHLQINIKHKDVTCSLYDYFVRLDEVYKEAV